jgi:hypothetical protein
MDFAEDTKTTESGGTETKFKTMSLRECAEFDMKNHARENLTGWGKICKDRASKGLSKRGNRRRARKGQ